MIKINFKRKKGGFTLVETLVAVSIFTMAILSMMVLVSRSISSTGYAKKKIIASYLAQEGIEYMRNMRDTYVLYSATSAAGWAAFNTKLSTASCATQNGCYFNNDLNYNNDNMPMTAITMTACGSTCPPLFYGSGRYHYLWGANSGYSRIIRMTVVSANETKIFSTVTWSQGSGTYSISLSENLFNWVE